MHRTGYMLLLVLAAWGLSGCASFSNVRSAQIHQGTSLSVRWTRTADLGEDATYLWTGGQLDECAPCSHGTGTLDVSARTGFLSGNGSRAYEFSVGMAGMSEALYAEGFVGWNQKERVPFGIGARGTVFSGDRRDAGRAYRLDGRLDWRLNRSLRLLGNPGVFYHTNGQGTGSWFLAFVPGAGIELSSPYVSFTPAVAWVFGTGRRGDSTARELGLEAVDLSVPTISVAVTVHPRRWLARQE